MTKKMNRVLIIGLDGATWAALDPWIRDGTLPNLARLRGNGSWGELTSTLPPVTAPAWATFMTGKRPGKHGMFHFIKIFEDNGSGDGKPEIVNARSIKSPALWDMLGHHDRQVVLINIPMTYPPRPVNGIMITGLLTPRNASVFTYPPELSSELHDYIIDLDRFIDVKPFQGTHEVGGAVVAPTLSLVREFRDMLESRAQASLSLMGSTPWDLFTVVFTGPDRMGHYLWPYHRAADEKDSPEVRQLCEAVRQYYVRLDEVVGDLVNQAGDDVSVLVMSDHGMGLKHSKRLHCNIWLHKHGWLSAKSDAPQFTNPDNWARRIGLPRDKVGRIVLRIPGLARSRFVKTAIKSRSLSVDLQHSQAYCVPMFNHVMGIRIMLSSERREVLRQEIMRELKQIVDPETGQAVVREVCKGEDYYYGPYAENIPDIIVVMEPDYACSTSLGTYSSVITKLQASPDGGGHRMEGIFLASGAHILARSERLPDLSLEDIAPTVLYLMDLPVPDDMDGRVLAEILTPTTSESRPIRYGKPMGFWPSADEAMRDAETLSREDDADIRRRLRALGYLE